VKDLSSEFYIVVYDGKKFKTYDKKILSDRSASPLKEFKYKLIGERFFSSYDYSVILGLNKDFNVVELDPINGKFSDRIKDIRKTFDKHDLILENLEDFKTITVSNKGKCIGVISWHGVLIEKGGLFNKIKGVEHKVGYTTERYVGTEEGPWGEDVIVTKKEEHFYYENAHIVAGAISPNGENIALSEDIMFKRCYAAIYSLKQDKYTLVKENLFEEPYYEEPVWLHDNETVGFSYRDKEFNCGLEILNIKNKRSRRVSLSFPIVSFDSSRTEKKFAIHCSDGNLFILDTEKKDLKLERVIGISGEILSLQWSPDANYLLLVSPKKKIWIINLENKKLTEIKGRFAAWYVAD